MKDAAAQLYERLLIVRCQAGDEAALRDLMDRYSPGLRFFLARIAGSAAADDLLQETWFAVYRNINSLRQPEAFAVWLYRIARALACHELRRRPAPAISLDERVASSSHKERTGEPAVFADDEGQSARQDFQRYDAADVRQALDELPADGREALVLRFMENMSYEQIAAVIDRPVGTVRSRIHYAKLALRAKLELTSIPKGETP